MDGDHPCGTSDRRTEHGRRQLPDHVVVVNDVRLEPRRPARQLPPGEWVPNVQPLPRPGVADLACEQLDGIPGCFEPFRQPGEVNLDARPGTGRKIVDHQNPHAWK